LTIQHRSLPKEKNGSQIFQIIRQHALKKSETTHILIHEHLQHSTEFSDGFQASDGHFNAD